MVQVHRGTCHECLDQKWNWKLHISSLSRKLGHRLSVFNRILHMLDKRTRLAYFSGLELPHLDYTDTIWGDQPGLTSEMQQLHAGFPIAVFQEDRRWQIVVSRGPGMVLKWSPLHKKALWTSMSYSSESNQGL